VCVTIAILISIYRPHAFKAGKMRGLDRASGIKHVFLEILL